MWNSDTRDDLRPRGRDGAEQGGGEHPPTRHAKTAGTERQTWERATRQGSASRLITRLSPTIDGSKQYKTQQSRHDFSPSKFVRGECKTRSVLDDHWSPGAPRRRTPGPREDRPQRTSFRCDVPRPDYPVWEGGGPALVTWLDPAPMRLQARCPGCSNLDLGRVGWKRGRGAGKPLTYFLTDGN
jgi:hypothetical protein